MALKNSTADGSVLLAKNSDRLVNEGHSLLFFPHQTHDPDTEVVKTTNLEIPQVEETYAILLSSPYWLYGCEMGANEYGVTIGNEAVFTKEKEQDQGLLGMDFIRLALERSKSAYEAVSVIIDLLEKYGQGGNHNCPGYAKGGYHNSWLIADLNEAWVLETANRFWCAEKVKDIRTISNALTIGKEFDSIHSDAINYAVEKGYCNRKDFHFAKAFTAGVTDIRTWGGKGLNRYKFTTQKLLENKGSIDTAFMMSLLREHKIKDHKRWNPSKSSFNDICVHCRPIFVISQTTGSLVSHLHPDLQTHWVTGTAAPCTSLFKPVFIEGGLPDIGPNPTNMYDSETMWWQHEQVHRAILEDYQTRIRIITPDINHYEEKWISKVTDVMSKRNSQPIDQFKQELAKLSKEAFEEAREIEKNWISAINKVPIRKRSGGFHYRRLWRKENSKAGIKL
ncbi:MAG: C69 family dipeptidase [Candidatus Thorarchaeota archaeon]